MHVLVELLPRIQNRTVELPSGSTGLDLVKALGLAPDAHILARGDVPFPIDEPVRDGETVRVIQVVSGG